MGESLTWAALIPASETYFMENLKWPTFRVSPRAYLDLLQDARNLGLPVTLELYEDKTVRLLTREGYCSVFPSVDLTGREVEIAN